MIGWIVQRFVHWRDSEIVNSSSVTIFEKTRKEKLRVEELCEETKQATVIRITFALPDAFEPVPESSPKLSIY